MNTNGTGVQTLLSFNEADGKSPMGDLTLSLDGSTLYGMTVSGGWRGQGTIFSLPVGGVGGGPPTTLWQFAYDGEYPYGDLTLSPDGSCLYGMTSSSYYGNGTIFRINTDGTGMQILFTFNGSNGGFPPAI